MTLPLSEGAQYRGNLDTHEATRRVQRMERVRGRQRRVVGTCFRQAIDTARRQQAQSLALRAAMSLERLWQGQGKRAEAHALLAPI